MPGISSVDELIMDNNEAPSEIVFPQQQSNLPTDMAEQIKSQGHITGTEMSFNLGGLDSKKSTLLQPMFNIDSNPQSQQNSARKQSEHLPHTIISRLNDKKVKRRE